MVLPAVLLAALLAALPVVLPLVMPVVLPDCYHTVPSRHIQMKIGGCVIIQSIHAA